ncbi:MAG: hypothetical protein A2015_02435 [Spirochaetes bacterium GWF1_31_7]|nr:MAG: hypothetical protein A2Y30_06280 [Spirochaetes bacterium GWE1_32_154]OHD50714.1 MAG: hypothetical protein A2Y29_09205 [Spirochaetes bacterium GWE2_31_10]OHD50770.1 MAG: hypothetical protein A2015_02435 [Spirochaetes bacterium GWF1_31_7]OHD73662.1 MAG: hypothetical protein A2355_11425 [Spirochaetes bacterium RIFOXYB1_FULL_32_8]HBD95109.1 hypothetical protein [Spirochaetia bacterium]
MADSKVLTTVIEFHSYSEIIIGPNDGYDLGILGINKKVKILANGEIIDGLITLNNKCKDLTVKINKRLHQKIGAPQKIKLTLNNENLIIHTM